MAERCVWVVGASKGIGRALATQLARRGNFVIASARNEGALIALATELESRVKIVKFDVGDTDELPRVREQLTEVTDYIDTVIFCAGICEYEDKLQFDPHMYERVFNTNFTGLVRTLNVAIPFLRASDKCPHIVAVSSLSTSVAFPRAEAYGASKAALDYFIRSLRVDLSSVDVDISLVRPGFVATELVKENDFSMPFLMSPDQAAMRIIKGMQARRKTIDFPLRLSIPLRLAGFFFAAWCRWVAPRLTRIKEFRKDSSQRVLPDRLNKHSLTK